MRPWRHVFSLVLLVLASWMGGAFDKHPAHNVSSLTIRQLRRLLAERGYSRRDFGGLLEKRDYKAAVEHVLEREYRQRRPRVAAERLASAVGWGVFGACLLTPVAVVVSAWRWYKRTRELELGNGGRHAPRHPPPERNPIGQSGRALSSSWSVLT